MVGTLFLVVISIFPVIAAADVQINIGLPPPVVFAAPPDVVVIPSGPSYVYMVPGTVGLYFYGGYWYRFHGGYWFRATHYSHPWVAIDPYLVPSPVVVIPADYILNMPPGYYRIRYHDFHKHWRDWGHHRQWHKYHWYNHHARQHWAGQDFHKPPKPSHGQYKPYDKNLKGRPATSGHYEKGPGGKPVDAGPQNKGPRAKQSEAGSHEKMQKGKPVIYDHPDNRPRGNEGHYDKRPQGKPVNAGPKEKGHKGDAGPGDRGGR